MQRGGAWNTAARSSCMRMARRRGPGVAGFADNSARRSQPLHNTTQHAASHGTRHHPQRTFVVVGNPVLGHRDDVGTTPACATRAQGQDVRRGGRETITQRRTRIGIGKAAAAAAAKQQGNTSESHEHTSTPQRHTTSSQRTVALRHVHTLTRSSWSAGRRRVLPNTAGLQGSRQRKFIHGTN